MTFAWDPSPDSSVVGYALYYGTSSGNYPTRLDAGSETSMVVTGLIGGETYYFAVVAYDANGIESLPSNELAYTVPVLPDQPPYIASLERVAGGAALTWTSAPGKTYRVMYKQNLTDAQWQNASPDLVATGDTLQWTDPALATTPQRFYSVIELP